MLKERWQVEVDESDLSVNRQCIGSMTQTPADHMTPCSESLPNVLSHKCIRRKEHILFAIAKRKRKVNGRTVCCAGSFCFISVRPPWASLSAEVKGRSSWNSLKLSDQLKTHTAVTSPLRGRPSGAIPTVPMEEDTKITLLKATFFFSVLPSSPVLLSPRSRCSSRASRP